LNHEPAKGHHIELRATT